MKHRTKRAPLSIKWNIFICFAMFTVVMLTVLWLCTTFFLDDIYQGIKTGEIRRAGADISALVTGRDWEDRADRIAADGDLCVVVYRMYGDSDGLELLSADHLTDCVIHNIDRQGKFLLYRMCRNEGGELIQRYRFDTARQVYVSLSDDASGASGTQESMVYARTVTAETGEVYFVLLNSLITPVGAAVNTIHVLLAAISVLLLILSAVLAVILSRRIARPIVRIRDAAGKLAGRQYDLQLRETGYREVAQLSDSLNHAGTELSKVDDLYRELISNISHDLRTPLTMITGYAEVMRDLPGENKPENVQVIIDEANRLTSLVNDVLDLSKYRSGVQNSVRTPFDLTESIKHVLMRYNKLAEQQGYQIDFHYSENVRVCSDEGRLMQAVYNLVNNALTYTDDSRRVLVEQTVHDGRVRISVTDYGEGIAQDQLPLIFDRYYRVGTAHRRPASGTGLGLAIVRTVMEQLDGAYGVSSRLGKGSTFWIELDCII